jgi:hypothetical protein
MTWINTCREEVETAINSFIYFPQNYDAVEANKNKTVMTDLLRRIFITNYGISRPGANFLLESGLSLSMPCAYYYSRQNLNFRIGNNRVRTRDAYECTAAFWSHLWEVFTAMQDKDNTHPEITQVM